jgi:ribonuclease HII
MGEASVEEIDTLNILQATMLAMQRAVMALTLPPTRVLVDGNRAPKLPFPTETVIKGDQKIPAISAASILAKTMRDARMEALHRQYPEYEFCRHKGYGTALHLAALARYGACPEHRKTFAPVREVLIKK